jgi:uncharacterized membrane protein
MKIKDMKIKAILLVIALIGILSTNCMATKKGTKLTGPATQSSLSGIILDKNSNEKLAGVTVQLTSTDQKIYSDSKGEFNLESLTPGTYKVKINCISYKEQEVSITISKSRNEKLKILLNPIEP